MNNAIKALRNQFKKYDIDGYIVPKNDDYFNEYSKHILIRKQLEVY